MPPPDSGRRIAATGAIAQLSLFDQSPPRAGESLAPVPDLRPVVSAPPDAPPGCLPDDARLWAISFAGDARGPQERATEATARYRARFRRAPTLVAVPLAELDSYRAAGVAALGDRRLARNCLYLLHPPEDRAREWSEPLIPDHGASQPFPLRALASSNSAGGR